jgi:hypothetical protein
VYPSESPRESVCVSVRHGQERDQLAENDAELPDLGRRRIHAAAVRAAGPLCLEGLLECASRARKKAAPLLGPRFKEARVVGFQERQKK